MQRRIESYEQAVEFLRKELFSLLDGRIDYRIVIRLKWNLRTVPFEQVLIEVKSRSECF